MAQPTKAGQKVTVPFTEGLLTVAGFSGESGIEYDTFSKARKANPAGIICVRNEEYNGYMNVRDCTVFVDLFQEIDFAHHTKK